MLPLRSLFSHLIILLALSQLAACDNDQEAQSAKDVGQQLKQNALNAAQQTATKSDDSSAQSEASDAPSETAGSDIKDSESEKVVTREGQPDYIKSDAKRIARATELAQKHLAEFADALFTEDESLQRFAIKKGYPVAHSTKQEHIWVAEVTFDGEQYHGIVSNQPVDTDAVKFDQEVSIKPEEISDWMYVKDGVLIGGYTIKALFEDKSDEERKAFFEQAGFSWK